MALILRAKCAQAAQSQGTGILLVCSSYNSWLTKVVVGAYLLRCDVCRSRIFGEDHTDGPVLLPGLDELHRRWVSP